MEIKLNLYQEKDINYQMMMMTMMIIIIIIKSPIEKTRSR